MSTRAAAAAAVLVLAACSAAQAGQAPAPTAPAGTTRDVSSRDLCGTPAFAAPVPSVERLRAIMARPAMRRDIAAVLTAAGLDSLNAETRQILADSLVVEAPQPVGTRIEWIARRQPQPGIDGPLRWAGPGPLAAFGFVIDDLSSTYTFIVPKRCGALALVTREPSLEAARRAEVARAADAARRAEEAVQERLRAAERERVELKARRDEELRQTKARMAVEAAQAAEERARDAVQQRAKNLELVAQALAADAAAAEAPRGVGVFVAPLAGAVRRRLAPTRDASWVAVVGARGGVSVPVGRRWTVRPALGVDSELGTSGYTRLSVETEVRLTLGASITVGAGVSLEDAARGDRARAGWLGTVGTSLGSPGRLPLGLLFEARRLFDRSGAKVGGYRLVTGIELRFR